MALMEKPDVLVTCRLSKPVGRSRSLLVRITCVPEGKARQRSREMVARLSRAFSFSGHSYKRVK